MNNHIVRFSPYHGDNPYIFISYPHKKLDMVFEIIQRLQSDQYRVWYDEGIAPGTEWAENIASHIEECSFFIALISEEYLVSSNCKDELHYACELEKPRLLIHLEDVVLLGGVRMRFNRLQAIYKYKYEQSETFYKKLYESVGIEKCLNSEFDLYDLEESFSENIMLDNLEVQIRIVYVVDTSGSMRGKRIEALNTGLEQSCLDLREKFGDKVGIDILEYSDISNWKIIESLPLVAGGLTNISSALNALEKYGMELSDAQAGVVIFLSNGIPTDEYIKDLDRLKDKFWYFRAIKMAFAIGRDASKEDLAELVVTPQAVLTIEDNMIHINFPAFLRNVLVAAVSASL